jgi:Kelch motif
VLRKPLSKNLVHIRIESIIFISLVMIAGSSPLVTAQSPPSDRAWLGSPVLNNGIYTIGGGICTDSSCGSFGGGETSIVEVFNSSTGQWMTQSPLKIARFGLSASETNGKIYVFGGTSGCCSAPEPSVEEYDPRCPFHKFAAS